MTDRRVALAELVGLLPRGAVSQDRLDLDLHASDLWPRTVLRRRLGDPPDTPLAVVRPVDRENVVTVVRWASAHRVPVVPYGGGTGVAGGALAVAGGITLDLSAMTTVGPVDHDSGTVEVEPGVVVGDLDAQLRAQGWTVAHEPQSLAYATIGGLLAVRSAGQSSTGYGRLEDRVVAIEAVLGDGTVVTTKPAPASAAGIDLKRVLLGGEGTTGIVTRATLRLEPAPAAVHESSFRFADVEGGMDGLRAVMRRGLRPAVLRLYDPADAAAVVSGWAGGALALVVVEGDAEVAAAIDGLVASTLTDAGGEALGPEPAARWRVHRYDVADAYIGHVRGGGTFAPGAVLDTMEVAATWSRLPATYAQVRAALMAEAETVLAHVSHVHPVGAALYFTFAAQFADDALALEHYDLMWERAQDAALSAGATISHHHGIGLQRVDHLRAELGEGGAELLRRIQLVADPANILNPGKVAAW